MKNVAVFSGLLMLVSSLHAQAFVRPSAPSIDQSQELPVEQVIYQGNPVLKNDLIAKSTYQLVLTNPKFPTLDLPSCTATLISKNVLLTAGHCLEAAEGVVYKIKFRGTNGKTQFATVTDYKIHEGYTSVRTERGDQVQNDIALIKINQTIPGSIAALLPSKSWKPAGDVVVAGYGLNGHTLTKEEILATPEGKAMMEKYQKNPPKTQEEITDFVAELMSLAEAKPLLWTRSKVQLDDSKDYDVPVMKLYDGDSICGGDSGGPSYVRSSNSSLVVVGVHSTSTNAACENRKRHWWSSGSSSVAYDTIVAFYVDWIRVTAATLK